MSQEKNLSSTRSLRSYRKPSSGRCEESCKWRLDVCDRGHRLGVLSLQGELSHAHIDPQWRITGWLKDLRSMLIPGACQRLSWCPRCSGRRQRHESIVSQQTQTCHCIASQHRKQVDYKEASLSTPRNDCLPWMVFLYGRGWRWEKEIHIFLVINLVTLWVIVWWIVKSTKLDVESWWRKCKYKHVCV